MINNEIPPIIHQIWIQGYSSIPPELKIEHANCKKINNNFEHILWTDGKIKELLKNNFSENVLSLYNSFTVMAQKADLARYAILYVYGGIYLDMDIVCRKNLEAFLTKSVFFTPYIFSKILKRYMNNTIGTVPKHPLFMMCIQNILSKNDHSNIIKSTGTGLFYDTVQAYLKTGATDINIIDRKYLYPCDIYHDESCAYNCTECYVAHTSYSSWSRKLQIIKFLRQNLVLIIVLMLLSILVIYLVVKHN